MDKGRETGGPRLVRLGQSAVVAALLVLLVLSPSACNGGETSSSPQAPAGSRAITFMTSDGVTLGGHLFGSGPAGIVLAHMYPADQTNWYPDAEQLAAAGYRVLTFDFRGYGESGGSKDIQYLDRDVLAAAAKLASNGASDMVLIGASMGGTACLKAADTSQMLSSLRVMGVATLSAPVDFKGLSAADATPKLMMPLLFIAAENDVGAEGARKLEELSGNKGDLQIVSGKDHGTDLLKGSQADQVWQLLLTFLQKTLPATGR